MPTIAKILRGLSPARREALLRLMPEFQLVAGNRHFPTWAHSGQLAPGPLDDGSPWRTWVLMAGRGFGKTRAGAEWVLDCVRSLSPREGGDPRRGSATPTEVPACAGTRGGGPRAERGVEGQVRIGATSRGISDPSVPRHHPADGPPPRPGEDPSVPLHHPADGPPLRPGEDPSVPLRHPADGPPPRSGEDIRIALVAATVDEARRVMVEGQSGLLACAREGEIAEWAPSRRELVFANGAVATLFSGASPEALRGPQHHIAWCDELAKWRHAEATWDMLQLGLRCGEWPRALVTTTPKGGCAALDRILTAPDTAETGGSSHRNPHLPPAFLEAIERSYGGTRMGREEIEGLFLRDVKGSLWPAELIERSRAHPDRCSSGTPAVPRKREGLFERVVIGVDPPASAEGTCGIVACGLGADGVGYVLADWTRKGLSPEGWARRVAQAAEAHGADRLVVERNQGGDMVSSVLRAAGIALPITPATATKSKPARAEPVAGLFELGRAKLAGRFPELEAELAGLVPAGYVGPGKSPDRADAMVWALWALMIAPGAEPRVWVV